MVRSHGWFQTAPFDWDEPRGVLTRTERLPGAPVGLRVRERRGAVAVTADRALVAAERVEVGARAARMLQLGADVSGFHAALAHDPALQADVVRLGAARLLAGTSLYEDVVKAVCATNIRWPQAVACIERIVAWSPDGAFPAPETLLAAGEARLRAEARVGYRAPALLEAARAALDGRLGAIERDAPDLDAGALAGRLAGLPGVGPSTAGFLGLLMGRYDLTVVDALTVRLCASRWFEGRRPSRAEILERVAAAGAWRGLALYWATLLGVAARDRPGARPLTPHAASGRRTRARSPRQRRTVASRVQPAAKAAPAAPRRSRRAGSPASRPSWRP